MDLSPINILAELDRIGWEYESISDTEVRCKCPFHEDKNPSCSLSLTKHEFKCHTAGCAAKGDALNFIARALNTTRRVALQDLQTRYDLESPKTISLVLVEKYHSEIWKAKPLLAQLHVRCVTDKMVRAHRIGVCRGRVTIPIYDNRGHCLNIRRYLPGAPGPQKMRNTKGFGGLSLYPIDQLKHDTVLLCGGEIKAVAMGILNKRGVGAITATAGEGNWTPKLNDAFKGKKVFVCFDIDNGGRVAASKVCRMLHVRARWVGDVLLPLDIEKHPHGDVNDWLATGATIKDWMSLLDKTEEWQPSEERQEKHEPVDMSLVESIDAKNTGKMIRVKATVTAMDTSPYIIPKKIRVLCERDQDQCGSCPLFLLDKDDKGLSFATVPSNSPAIIDMVASPKQVQHKAILAALRTPPCKAVELQPVEWYNVEEGRLSPQLQIVSKESNSLVQPVLIVGKGTELNESYAFMGSVYPHPKTQQCIMLASERNAIQDTLSEYKPDNLETLQVFQPETWTTKGLESRLNCIYTDLEQHVTRIFKRRDLHLALDLIWHSALFIRDGKKTIKGWAELLVLGDSAQGKSETTLQLTAHYGLGEKIEMKNATVAGLLGGLQQLGNRWFVSWGVVPMHDRRLVILEELKGASTELIGKLTDMRSSGIAEIPKIERRRTHARTRIIALSNPRSDRSLSTYNFGVDAIKELIGGLEDIRRFDLILVLSAGDVDADEISKMQSQTITVPHVYTGGLCRNCILWAWTREPEQIHITDGALSVLTSHTLSLCKDFTETIPIIDRGSTRFKILRLATALACRTFSHGKLMTDVLVRECHIEYIVEFMRRIYSSRTFGYKRFSEAVHDMSSLVEPEAICQQISQTPFPLDFIKQLLQTDYVELRDLCDWCAWGRDDAMQLLSFFVRKHALRRRRNAYIKTPEFIELLKKLEKDVVQRPEYIGECNEY